MYFRTSKHPAPRLPCTRMTLSLSGEHVWESIPCDKNMASMAVCEFQNETVLQMAERNEFGKIFCFNSSLV